MKKYIMIIILVGGIFMGFAACGEALDVDVSEAAAAAWVDTSLLESPEKNDREFLPEFVKANKKNLDQLAKMMLKYDFTFNFYKRDGEIRIYTNSGETDKTQAEKERLLLQDAKMMAYVTALLELSYIDTVESFEKEGKKRVHLSAAVCYDLGGGTIFRGVSYIRTLELLWGKAAGGEYIAGNWYFSEYFMH